MSKMKSIWAGLLTLLIATTGFAGERFYNSSGVLLGTFSDVKCSTNLTCSIENGRLKIVAATSSVSFANGESMNNDADDTVEVLSDDNDTTFQITGFEAKAAILNLWADQGDDAADKFSITATSSDTLLFKNSTTQILGFDSAGVMTLADSETITNSADVVSIGFDDAAANVKLVAFEATDANLILQADESDDNGDDWMLKSAASGNAFSILNDTSGSQVAKLTISSSLGNVTGPGTGSISGFIQNQIQATATTITAAQCGSTFYNAGAITINLPDGTAGLLGCRITFITLNATNFVVNPGNADQIMLLTNAAGDSITNATVADVVILQYAATNEWVDVGHIGTWSDTN